MFLLVFGSSGHPPPSPTLPSFTHNPWPVLIFWAHVVLSFLCALPCLLPWLQTLKMHPLVKGLHGLRAQRVNAVWWRVKAKGERITSRNQTWAELWWWGVLRDPSMCSMCVLVTHDAVSPGKAGQYCGGGSPFFHRAGHSHAVWLLLFIILSRFKADCILKSIMQAATVVFREVRVSASSWQITVLFPFWGSSVPSYLTSRVPVCWYDYKWFRQIFS